MAMIKTCSTQPIAFPEVSGPVCSFKALQALPLKKCEVAINAWQEGSGDPSPSNERTIHGWDKVNLTRAGKNLFDYDSITIDNITFNTITGTITKNGFIYHLPNGEYTISARGTAQSFVYMNIMASDGSFKEQVRLSTTNPVWITKTFTLVDGDYIIIFAAGSGATLNISSNEFMIEVGSTDTSYNPYQGNTYTIDLDGTRYGGVLNALTGEMSVTYSLIDLGSLSWDYIDARKAFRSVEDIFTDESINDKSLCSEYQRYKYSTFINDNTLDNSYSFGSGNSYIRKLIIRDLRFDNPTDFKNSLDGVYLTYRISEPFTVQLTPVQIDTILNTNNIFADTGDTAVQYIKIGG